MEDKVYIAIDLKSFYASVECVQRGLDPLGVNLVVADPSRTEKTICLAVSPSLKSFGIGGRARLFEVVQKVKEVNSLRKIKSPHNSFTGKSYVYKELTDDNSLELDYIVAPPQMKLYMDTSNKIYSIYLRYIAPEDMHIYSVDEVFIDATHYLKTYGLSPRELAMKLILEVLNETGITATAGIGPNMYLCKVAMDVEAKHIDADENGVRIAELDEMSYRRKMWNHLPLTDFWRYGRGTVKRLEKIGLYTLGDIAECSVANEDILYKVFGVNAELLIDHAWGWEPCTIAEIKQFKPENNSISQGQVLQEPYTYEKGLLVVREMSDILSLDLVEKRIVTDQVVLTVGYDTEGIPDDYKGEIVSDHYGRPVPKPAHGSKNLDFQTSSGRMIMDAVAQLYEEIVDKKLYVRRMYVVANHVVPESKIKKKSDYVQLDLFTDYEALEHEEAERNRKLEREKNMQKAVISLKNRFGKNSVLRGMNFEEGATARARNGQVGGHKA